MNSPAPAWPWYIAGPLIGLLVPLMLLTANKLLGVSSNFRHVCAAILPSKNVDFLKYDWKSYTWSLVFALGILAGGAVATFLLGGMSAPIFPEHYYSSTGLLQLLGGGFLIGFGSRYAGGCTSGHGIAGLSTLQWPSVLAVISFFIGGLLFTNLVL